MSIGNMIGVEEASQLWGLSPGYIKNLCAEDKILSKKIGKTWVIDKMQTNPKTKGGNNLPDVLRNKISNSECKKELKVSLGIIKKYEIALKEIIRLDERDHFGDLLEEAQSIASKALMDE